MGEQLQQGEVLAVNLSHVPLEGTDGVVWGLDSPQLNANLVKLDAGHEMPEHASADLDVLILVQAGEGVVVVDQVEHVVQTDSLLLVPAGARRVIRATRRLVYFSIHARRDGLNVR